MASTVYRTVWASTLEAVRMRVLRRPIGLAFPVGILRWEQLHGQGFQKFSQVGGLAFWGIMDLLHSVQ